MTDLELIKQAQRGATDCFAQLVARHQLALYRFLLARCHRPDDADDVLQETFLNAHRYLESYNAQWAFSTWLFTIAKRILGRIKPQYHVPLEWADEQPDDTISAEQEVEHDNLWRIIKNHISADHFEVLWLYYAEDLGINEISQIMNQSTSWVKTSLYRSKIKLNNNSALADMLGVTA